MCGRRESGQDVCQFRSGPKTGRGKKTNEGDQGNSKFTNLLDDALCRAIWSSRDDAVVSPSDIENTTHGLQKVECEKGELPVNVIYELSEEHAENH